MLTFGGSCQGFDRHPCTHGNHHRAFSQRYEAEGNVASAAYAGTFELSLFDVDSLDDGHNADTADEQ